MPAHALTFGVTRLTGARLALVLRLRAAAALRHRVAVGTELWLRLGFGLGLGLRLGEARASAPAPEPHGTEIAGILVARSELTGVAPDAKLLGVRAFRGSGRNPATSTSLQLLKGINWAFDAGAKVMI